MKWIFGIVVVICITLIILAALDSLDKKNGRDDDEWKW